MITLQDKLKALEGVIGSARLRRLFIQREQADTLGFDATKWNRIVRSIEPVDEYVAGRLLDYFKLGPELDYRLFQVATTDEFIERLKAAGLGTFGFGHSRKLAAWLAARAVEIVQISRKSTETALNVSARLYPAKRGITAEDADDFGPNDFEPRSRVSVSCKGVPGRVLVLLSISLADNPEISVLSPSEKAPMSICPERGSMQLPSHGESFGVSMQEGNFRLCAVFTTPKVAQAFEGVWIDDLPHRGILQEHDARLILGSILIERQVPDVVIWDYQIRRRYV